MSDEPLCGGSSNTPAQNTSRAGKVRCLIDWLGFTFLDEDINVYAVLELFEVLTSIPISSWQKGRQHYEGYAESYVFENINIYFKGAPDKGIHVDITGQGCRYLEIQFRNRKIHDLSQTEYSWYRFISIINDHGAKFTRFDGAIDDFSNYFTVPFLFYKLTNGECRSKFKSWTPDGRFSFDGQAKTGMTLYFGTKVSRIQVVIYEKAKQLGLQNVNWTRTEVRFRHERAIEFVQMILARNTDEKSVSMGVMLAGILKSYITFIEPSNDKNKARWPISPFWNMFLDSVEPLRLTSALPDRSIQRAEKWFKDQVSKSYLMMELAFYGLKDDWKERMLQEGFKKLKPRDIEIVNEYRRLFEQHEQTLLDSAIDIGGFTGSDDGTYGNEASVELMVRQREYVEGLIEKKNNQPNEWID